MNQGVEFAVCTNAIYIPVLGGTAKELKVDRELRQKDNLRDHLDDVELSAVSLSESLASERIEVQSLFGMTQCESACKSSATAVASAITMFRADA